MASPFDSLFNAQLQTRKIIISEAVTPDLLTRVTALLMALEKEPKPIEVLINSPGGVVDSGMGIHDLLVSSPCEISTLVSGMCASAGVCIFLAAPKDRRTSLPNSRFMMHQPKTQAMGNTTELEIIANELRKTKERYFGMIAAATGKKPEVVAKDCDRDYWLTANEAREYGLVSKIIETRPAN